MNATDFATKITAILAPTVDTVETTTVTSLHDGPLTTSGTAVKASPTARRQPLTVAEQIVAAYGEIAEGDAVGLAGAWNVGRMVRYWQVNKMGDLDALAEQVLAADVDGYARRRGVSKPNLSKMGKLVKTWGEYDVMVEALGAADVATSFGAAYAHAVKVTGKAHAPKAPTASTDDGSAPAGAPADVDAPNADQFVELHGEAASIAHRIAVNILGDYSPADRLAILTAAIAEVEGMIED